MVPVGAAAGWHCGPRLARWTAPIIDMRPFLRFPFRLDEHDLIDDDSIEVTDQPFSAEPVPGDPYPQAMRIAFDLAGGTLGPQVLPLFPGSLTFLADPDAPGALPSAADVDPGDTTAYAGWRTRGALRVQLVDRQLLADLEHPALRVAPNTVWMWPVRITAEFLFESLASTGAEGLRSGSIAAAAGARIAAGSSDWLSHAIAGFLGGSFAPVLRLHPTDATQDTVAALPMPRVELTGTAGELVVCAARSQAFQDWAPPSPRRTRTCPLPTTEAEIGEHGLDLERGEADPHHRANGAIPARLVYLTYADALIDADPGLPVADAVLRAWPAAPRYVSVRFTRTWQAVPNHSAYLAGESARVTTPVGTVEQRLPAHGVLFVPEEPASPWPSRQISVGLADGSRMLWLDGRGAHRWRVPAAAEPVAFDLSVPPFSTGEELPHVIVRRRLADELWVEPCLKAEASCSYTSLRRLLRALVNNRIAGGRLSFGVASTSWRTRQLIEDAWADAPSVTVPITESDGTVVDQLIDPGPDLCAGNMPPASDPSTKEQLYLLGILVAFFPEAATKRAPALPDPTQPRTVGRVAYDLYFSILANLRREAITAYYDPLLVGRGGAGGAVYLDLASDVVVDAIRGDQETVSQFYDRNVAELLDRLEPGAILQQWHTLAMLQAALEAQQGSVADGDIVGGHAPIFHSFLDDAADGLPAGVRVLDQTGLLELPIERTFTGSAGSNVDLPLGDYRRIPHFSHGDIWLAANLDRE